MIQTYLTADILNNNPNEPVTFSSHMHIGRLYFIQNDFKLDDFEYPAEILHFFQNKTDKVLLVVGPSGFGKTQSIITLANHFHLCPQMLRNENDMQHVTEANKLLIFDDYEFNELTRSKQLALLDSNASGLKFLFKYKKINPDVKKVFLSNFVFNSIHLKEINRRLEVVLLKKPIIKNHIYSAFEKDYEASNLKLKKQLNTSLFEGKSNKIREEKIYLQNSIDMDEQENIKQQEQKQTNPTTESKILDWIPPEGFWT